MWTPGMQSILRISRVPRRSTVMTWTAECFNNGIKKALLILLLWTLICRPGECLDGSAHKTNQLEHDNNSSNASNLYEQPRINDVGDNLAITPTHQSPVGSELLTAAEWHDSDDEQRLMEDDQFSKINKTLNSLITTNEGPWSRVEEQETRKLFKRDLAKAGKRKAAEQKSIGKRTTMDSWDEAQKDGSNYAVPEQITGMQATKMLEASINGDGKINEHQNARNNGNCNTKRPEVVDTICATTKVAATTQLPIATATNEFTETPALADLPLPEEQQQNVDGKMAQNSAARADDDEAHGDALVASHEPRPVDVTAVLQQQLIYEFAIKYKHIPRVTFFTCRWLSGGRVQGAPMTYLNMQTVEILQRMYGNRGAGGFRSNTDATMAKSAADKAPTKANATKTPSSVAPKMTSVADISVGQARGNSRTNSQCTTTTATLTNATKMATGNILKRGKGNIRRDAGAAAAAGDVASQGDILIKVVHIDQLINKRPATANNKNTNNNYNWYRSAGVGDAGFGRTRNAYRNANWLAQALGGDGSRQIVVLNLACGAASRRLLEMASNKALFNSTYHWLLIEDYTFNRQTGYDGNDKSEHQNNEQVKNSNNNKNTNDYSDNDDSDRLAGKYFQQKQSQQLQQSKISATSTVAIGAAGYATTFATTTNNEHDMEIIEKYLEKINININTELILAKRHTRRIRDDDAMRGTACRLRAGRHCTFDNESATINTLQTKDYYQLYDIWSPGLQYGGQLNISEIGYFALDDGLQIALWYRRSTTITRRMDMKMARIRCLIVVTNRNHTDSLEHYITTPYDAHLDSMNRFNFALLSNVRDLFNFSFVLSKTASWGYLKNGKFDGMIGALVRKQTDIGGSPIFFRIERAKVIDYTTRTWVARPCFIFRHPPSTTKDRIVFLQPFSNTVWILLGLCGIFTICLLWLLSRVERRLDAFGVVKRLGHITSASKRGNSIDTVKQQNTIGGNDELPGRCNSTRTAIRGSTMHYCSSCIALVSLTKEQRKQKLGKLVQQRKADGRKDVKRISCRHCMLWCGNACCGQTGSDVAQQGFGLLFESVLFYVGSICQQGLTFSTSFFSGRCVVLTSLLFAFAIYQFYSASIVGTLLMEKPKTIRTLRDLIHSSLEVGVEDIAYNRDFFLRTNDPVAIELYAKKVNSIPLSGETLAETAGRNATVPQMSGVPGSQPNVVLTEAQKAKAYRDILHSHVTGAHAKTNDASNWYDPDYGVNKIRKGKFAFHVDVATAYKIIADTFNEKEICELTEIQLFPPQKMVSIVQKGSPLRKMITYGLRRVTETGLMDYQRKVWHSPKPRCVKQIHTDDLRVDIQTFASALLVLIFGCAVSLLALSIELIQHKLWQRYTEQTEEE
ncbi:uncharacterized protein LOC128861075 [Anastrepha ludens]|uniref:uncharacterized protein LOC128861075 n=1 Tax=Anastrepha ludens TaxID=28586 RepID=UPI0023B0E697|nr:uncharacterized protein LOC128861075 [Anastrepha ludens]